MKRSHFNISLETLFLFVVVFIGQLFINSELKAQSENPNDKIKIACNAVLDSVNYSMIGGSDFTLVPIYDALKNELQNNGKQGMIGCYFKKNYGSEEIGQEWSLDGCAKQYCADKDPKNPITFDHDLCKRIVMATIAYRVNGAVSSIAHIWKPGGLFPSTYDWTESFEKSSDIFGSCPYDKYIQGEFLKVDLKGIKTIAGGQLACCIQRPIGKTEPVACLAKLQPCANWNKDYQVYALTDQERSVEENKGCHEQEKTYNTMLQDMFDNKNPIKIGTTEYNGDDKVALGIGSLCASRSNITDSKVKTQTDLWCPKLSEACCRGAKALGCSGKFDVASSVLDDNVFNSSSFADTNIPKRPVEILFRPSVGFPGTDFEGGVLTTINAGSFGRFIGQFFGLALSIIAIFAILMIIIAGTKMYLAAARGNITEAAKAKDGIKKAITGLVFTLAAVTLFRFINPRLIEIPSLTSLSNKYTIEKETINFPEIYDANTGSYEMPDDALVKKVLEYHNAGKISIQDKINQNESALKEIDANGLKLMLAMGDYATPQNAGKDFNIRITALKKDHPVNTVAGNVSPHASGRGIDFGTGSGISKANIEKLLVWLNSNKSQFKIGQIIYDSSVLSASYDRLKYNYDWRATPPPFKSTLLDDHRDHIHITILASDKATSSTGGGSQCGIFGKSSAYGNLSANTSQVAFVNKLLDTYNKAGVVNTVNWPKEVMIAQGIIESKWGTSNKATSINNYFGMRCSAASDRKCDGGFGIYADINDNMRTYFNWMNDPKGNYADNRKKTVALIGKPIDFTDPCKAAFFGLLYTHKYTPDPAYVDSIMGVIKSMPKFGIQGLNGNANCSQDYIAEQFGSDVVQNYKAAVCK